MRAAAAAPPQSTHTAHLHASLCFPCRWPTTSPSWPASAPTCGPSPCARWMDRGTHTPACSRSPARLSVHQHTCLFSRHTVGDTKVPFCLQSCVKPLKYAIAVHDHGTEYVHRFIGKEPSGLRFNKLFLNEDGEEPDHAGTSGQALAARGAISRPGCHGAVINS